MVEKSRFSNEYIARMLKEVAAAYEIKGESQFRIRAYDNAAASVEHATEEVRDLWEEGKLDELPGVGQSIADHLDEYFQSGGVRHFDRVKRGLPKAMFNLLDVPRIGAKTAYILSKSLKLREKTAKEDLFEAADKGKIRLLPGFGEVSEKDILQNLGKVRKNDYRMVLPEAAYLSEKILNYLKDCPMVIRADSLGSLRRRVATIGDIDIAVSTNHPKDVVEYFVKYPEAVEVVNEGGLKGRIILNNGRQVDLMTQKPSAYGALLQHFTGSKNHNISLREIAKVKGLSLSEYGIKDKRGRIIESATEEEFYQRLGLKYIEPELREDRGEIESAIKGILPNLIKLSDIKGDLQTHTRWSDGRNTAEEMVKEAQNKGYQYIGLTDHQQSITSRGVDSVIGEMDRRIDGIDQIRYSYKSIRVLNGIEINIKSDGQLSYTDDILKRFDYVIASIHTSFTQSKDIITKRIIRAIKNPYVKILAHPTGRLLGRRDGIDADWEEIFKEMVKERKIIEINSFPQRLDLPDILVKTAKDIGLKFVINTDAHSIEHLELMEFGVSVARRGWLETEDVINTLPFDKLKYVLGIKGV